MPFVKKLLLGFVIVLRRYRIINVLSLVPKMSQVLPRGHGGRPPDEDSGESSQSSNYSTAGSALEPQIETERSRQGSRSSSLSHSVTEDYQVFFDSQVATLILTLPHPFSLVKPYFILQFVLLY